MATNKSEHLQLNLWEPEDSVLREEFNENWEKIDGAAERLESELAKGLEEVKASLNTGGKLCRIAWGSYTGTGTCGSSARNSLTFDFAPRFVAVGSKEDSSTLFNTILYPMPYGVLGRSGAAATLKWSDTGVTWYSSSAADQLNTSGTKYFYVAIGAVV